MHKGVRGEQGGGVGVEPLHAWIFPIPLSLLLPAMQASIRDTRLFLGNATNKSASGYPIGIETHHCNQGRQWGQGTEEQDPQQLS